MNEAWAAPDSLLDLFIKSFKIGDGTRKLLKHLVVIALDDKAYSWCSKVHSHCYALFTNDTDFHTEAFFMTPTYLQMMWRRIDFLRTVLEMGYNFVFTVSSFDSLTCYIQLICSCSGSSTVYLIS